MVAHDRAEENREPTAPLASSILVALCALLLAVHWELGEFDPQPYGTAAIDGADVEMFAPAGGSPVLIFGVSALLLFGRRQRFVNALGSPPRWLAGGALFLLGALLQRWADYVGATELLVSSLILLLSGTAALAAGRDGLRAVAIPSLFLVFAFPIPAALVNSIVWPLQSFTATSTGAFLSFIGYEPQTYGDVITLGGNAFQVIETCSGMRTIETLTMAACLYSILFYRNRSQVIVLVLAAPVIGVFVNFVRVLTIIFNPYAEWTSVHTLQGVVMLVVGVLMIAGVDALSSRWPRSAAIAKPRTAGRTHPDSGFHGSGIAVAAAGLLILATGNLTLPRWIPEATPVPRAFRLPGVLADSKPIPRKLDREFLGSVGVSNWLNREYTIQGRRVRLQILADDRLHRGGSLVSEKTRIPGRGFVAVTRDTTELFSGVHVDRILYQSRQRRVLVYHWTEGISGLFREIVRDAFDLDRGPMRRNGYALAVQLSTEVTPDASDMKDAEARLRELAHAMRNAVE